MQKVENRLRILSDLRDLASAESPDSFTLVYTNILEHQPDCPVSALMQFIVDGGFGVSPVYSEVT